MAYLAKKQYADGEAALHQAIAIDPQFALGYFYLAGIPRKLSVRRVNLLLGGIPVVLTTSGEEAWPRKQGRLRTMPSLLIRLPVFAGRRRQRFGLRGPVARIKR